MSVNPKTKAPTKRAPSGNATAARNHKLRLDAMRRQISNMKLVDGIVKNVKEADKLKTEAGKLNLRTELNREQTKTALDIKNFQLKAITVKINTEFRLLVKTLPDMRTIEVKDEDGNDLLKSFMEAVTNGPNS